MIKLKAYAKINLTLDITGKRSDGYHTIESVMQTISLCDEVRINENFMGKINVNSNSEFLPTDENNTAFKAAKVFLNYTDIRGKNVDIYIDKKIPSRAGMGGGSADAAAVLWGMNDLFSANLSMQELMLLGAKVGADVPFCLAGGTCHCKGIGEQITRADPMPDCFILICKPPAGVSTPRAYANVDKHPFTSAVATPKMLNALRTGQIQNVASALSNRFDEVLRISQVQNIKKTMRVCGAINAMMTGSGSAVYGIFDSQDRARECAEKLKDSGELFLAKPVNM